VEEKETVLPKKLAVPAAAILVLSGTVGLGRQGSPAQARTAHDNYSGSVAITDYQFPDSLSLGGAFSNGVADVELAGAMVDGLLNFDENGHFFADLATEVPTSANGGIKVTNGVETVTYHLKPNQKWSDGSPITNADWVGTLMLDFSPEYNATNGIIHIKSLTFSGNDMIITYKTTYAAALSYGLP
jgi:ABC-type transport system substrate-binding protein